MEAIAISPLLQGGATGDNKDHYHNEIVDVITQNCPWRAYLIVLFLSKSWTADELKKKSWTTNKQFINLHGYLLNNPLQ